MSRIATIPDRANLRSRLHPRRRNRDIRANPARSELGPVEPERFQDHDAGPRYRHVHRRQAERLESSLEPVASAGKIDRRSFSRTAISQAFIASCNDVT
jgi:hypothetical protein